MKRLQKYLISIFMSIVLCFSVLSLSSCSKRKALEQGMITLERTSYVYDGLPKQPAVTVTKKGKQISSEHYSVTYQNNISVGTASVIISASDKSKEVLGSVTIYFEIVKAELDVNLSFSDVRYDGQNHYPNFSINGYDDSDYTYHWEYKSNLSSEFVLLTTNNFVNAGQYKLVVSGTGNYTGEKEFSFNIKPVEVDLPTVTGQYVYNGQNQQVEISPASSLYEVVLNPNENYINVGTHNFKVALKDKINYVWASTKSNEDLTLSFDVTAKSLQGGNVEFVNLETTYSYNGEEQKPNVKVVFDGADVGAENYDVTYSNNINAGTATVKVTGKNNYYGELTATFEINPKNLTGVSVLFENPEATYTYSGEEYKPSVYVLLEDETILDTTHYDVSYINNINAGTAIVTVTAKGNYAGEFTTTFSIAQKILQGGSVLFTKPDAVYSYNAAEQTPSVYVVLDNLTLSSEDYDVSYSNNIEIGQATITVTGKGNYTGELMATFEILPNGLYGSTVLFENPEATYTYSGEEYKPSVYVLLEDETILDTANYDVSYEDNINAGTATVIVTGKGNYAGQLTKTFVINQKSVAGGSVLFTNADATYTYNGTAQTPSVYVVLEDKTLGVVNYEVAYTNNTNAGIATITVTAKGNYIGTLTTTFEINQKSVAGGSVLFTNPDATYIYNGEAQAPSVYVVLEDKTLDVANYDVAYTNNTNAGTATITVTAKGNYTGTLTTTLEINQKSVAGGSVLFTNDDATYTYNGTEQTPSVYVILEDKTLDAANYEVAYTNNTNAGTATITVTAKGNYTGQLTKTFVINQKSVAGGSVEFTNPDVTYTFNGESQTPSIYVVLEDKTLDAANYEVAYTNNTNAGTATITVTAKGNYTGTLTTTFAINKKSIAGGSLLFTNADVTYTYNGTAQTPSIYVVLEDKTLDAANYEVAYTNNTNAGTATITVTAKGNYTGTLTTTFEINQKSVAGGSVLFTNPDATYTYNGTAQTPSVYVVLEDKTLDAANYEVAYTNNTNAGTATITVTAKGNYTGTLTTTFAINQKSIAGGSVLFTNADATYTYNGTAQTPSVYVVLEDKTLDAANYEVAYTNNINAGTATVTVTAKGNYTGTLTTTFEIAKNSIASGSVEFTNADATYTYNGTAQTPSVYVVLEDKTLDAANYEVAYTNNTNAGTATVTVTAKGNYAGQLTKTFVINQKSVAGGSVEFTNADTTYTYNGAEQTPSVYVVLENKTLDAANYDVAYTNNTNAGTATITVTAKGNYTGTLTTTFAINQKSVASGSVEFTNAEATYTYNGTAQTPSVYVVLEDKTLDAANYDVAYTNNTNAGTATITVTAKGNYTGTLTTTFAINQKSIAGGSVELTNADATYTYNGAEQTPSVYVVLEDKTLDATNYDVAYTNNTNAGTAIITVTIKDTSNYTGELTKEFTILRQPVSRPVLKSFYAYNEIEEYIFGQEEFTAFVDGNELEENVVLDAGIYTITLKLNDEINSVWADSVDPNEIYISFEIIIEAGVIRVPQIPTTTFVYNGTEQSVFADTKNYSVSNNKQTNAGTYDVVIALNNAINFVWVYDNDEQKEILVQDEEDKSILRYTFVIEQEDINNAVLTFENNVDEYTFTGSAINPTFSITYNGKTLSEDDYNLSWENNLNAGVAKINVLGTRNFKSTKPVEFTILPKPILVPTVSNFVYDGLSHSAVPSSTEYSALNGTQTNAGTYSITISLANNNYIWIKETGNDQADIETSFTILPAVLDTENGTTLEFKDDLEYTGFEIVDAIKVLKHNEYVLAQGDDKDYVAEFENNINAGLATITITGKNNYSGTLVRTFNISRKKISEPELFGSYTYNGEEQNLTYRYNDGLFKVVEGDIVNAGTRNILIGFVDENNYAWANTDSKTVSIELTIEKAKLLIPDFKDKTIVYTYNGKLQEAELTNLNSHIVASGNSNTNAGTYPVTVSIADLDKSNFCWNNVEQTSDSILLGNFVINKANIATSNIVLSETFNFTGNPVVLNLQITFGEDEQVLVENTDYSLTYSSESIVNAGDYTVTISGCGTNFNGSVVKPFKIVTGAILENNIELSETSATYNGTDVQPTITVKYPISENGEVVYKTLEKGTDYSYYFVNSNGIQVDALVNHGTYTIKFVGSVNYTTSVEIEFVVNKATYKGVTAQRSGYNYHETPSGITLFSYDKVISESTIEGEVSYYYSTENNTENLTLLPKNETEFNNYIINAGTYYLFVGISESANYNEYLTETGYKFVISKAYRTGITVGRPEVELVSTYRYNNPEDIVIYNTDGSEYAESDLLYYYFVGEDEENAELFSKDKVFDIGEYNFFVIISESNNYYEYRTNTASFEVLPCERDEITISKAGYTYGEEPTRTVLTGYSGNDVVYYYSLIDSNKDGLKYIFDGTIERPENLAEFDAGTYYIYAEIPASENFAKYVTSTSSFIVQQASQDGLTVVGSDYIYGEEPSSDITLSDTCFGGVRYYYNLTNTTEGGKEFIQNADYAAGLYFNAGVYYIYAVISGDTNHMGYTTGTFKLTVGYVVVTAPELSNKTFTGFDQILVAENDEFYTISGDGNVQTNVGDYNLTVQLRDTTNFVWSDSNDSKNKVTTISILPVSLASVDVELEQVEFTYDTTGHEPAIKSITLGSYPLTNSDYLISYVNNVNAGNQTAKVVLTPKTSNFTGTKELLFTILKAEYTHSQMYIVYSSFNYGDTCNFTLSKAIEEGTVVTYYLCDENKENAKNFNEVVQPLALGEYFVYATIISNNYEDFETNVMAFNVTRTVLVNENVTISSSNGQYDYTGENVDIELAVTYNGKALVVDEDYTVNILYKGETAVNICDAGTYTVTVTGINNYNGIVELEIKVIGIDIEGEGFAFDILGGTDDGSGNIAFDFTGGAITPEISGEYNGEPLTSGTHFAVSYSNNTNAGTATVTITGIAPYSGTRYLTFIIVSGGTSIKDATITNNNQELYYNGNNHLSSLIYQVRVNGTLLTRNIHYTVSWSVLVNGEYVAVDNIINANTYYGTITAVEDSGYTGTATNKIVVKVLPISLSNLITSGDVVITITPSDETSYTGGNVMPTIIVEYNGNELTQDVDYYIEVYDSDFTPLEMVDGEYNLVEVGYYYIIIYGMNNFEDFEFYGFSVV